MQINVQEASPVQRQPEEQNEERYQDENQVEEEMMMPDGPMFRMRRAKEGIICHPIYGVIFFVLYLLVVLIAIVHIIHPSVTLFHQRTVFYGTGNVVNANGLMVSQSPLLFDFKFESGQSAVDLRSGFRASSENGNQLLFMAIYPSMANASAVSSGSISPTAIKTLGVPNKGLEKNILVIAKGSNVQQSTASSQSCSTLILTHGDYKVSFFYHSSLWKSHQQCDGFPGDQAFTTEISQSTYQDKGRIMLNKDELIRFDVVKNVDGDVVYYGLSQFDWAFWVAVIVTLRVQLGLMFHARHHNTIGRRQMLSFIIHIVLIFLWAFRDTFVADLIIFVTGVGLVFIWAFTWATGFWAFKRTQHSLEKLAIASRLEQFQAENMENGGDGNGQEDMEIMRELKEFPVKFSLQSYNDALTIVITNTQSTSHLCCPPKHTASVHPLHVDGKDTAGEQQEPTENELLEMEDDEPEAEESDDMTATCRYYCPICMIYYSKVKSTDCCKNYICKDCALGFISGKDGLSNAIQRLPTRPLHIPCPFCTELDFCLEEVLPTDVARRYEDSPSVSKTRSSSAFPTPSPLKIGASFEDMRRKLVTFDQAQQAQARRKTPKSKGKLSVGWSPSHRSNRSGSVTPDTTVPASSGKPPSVPKLALEPKLNDADASESARMASDRSGLPPKMPKSSRSDSAGVAKSRAKNVLAEINNVDNDNDGGVGSSSSAAEPQEEEEADVRLSVEVPDNSHFGENSTIEAISPSSSSSGSSEAVLVE